MHEPFRLTAVEAKQLITKKRLTSEALVRSCLERIKAREDIVGAWDSMDEEAALIEARARDAEEPRGPLHGLPMGIKDIIDTVDFPTRLGSVAFADRQPERDAECVKRIKEEGGVILGKNVTTEFAYFTPGKTRNPHDSARTPGGSSSGSAAAVADFMVPLSIGTQAAGSTVRPASFCGVVGFKPTHQRWDMSGALRLYPSLDTLSVFSRCIGDALLIDSVLGGEKNESDTLTNEAVRVALYLPHEWDRAEAATRSAMEYAETRFRDAGAEVVQVSPPSELSGLVDASDVIVHYEAWQNSGGVQERGDKLSPVFRKLLERGKGISMDQYEAAKAYGHRAETVWNELLSGFDVALTPSVTGEAPKGLTATGDPVFIRTFNVIGVPTMNLPLATGPEGLPIGVQLVGLRNTDRHLLGVASRLMDLIGRVDLS